MDRAEIFTEASPYAMTSRKLCLAHPDPIRTVPIRSSTILPIQTNPLDDFENFFGLMDTECDVDHIPTCTKTRSDRKLRRALKQNMARPHEGAR